MQPRINYPAKLSIFFQGRRWTFNETNEFHLFLKKTRTKQKIGSPTIELKRCRKVASWTKRKPAIINQYCPSTQWPPGSQCTAYKQEARIYNILIPVEKPPILISVEKPLILIQWKNLLNPEIRAQFLYP
ncbi:uncharacterized protein ACOB8E_012385 [Sarcophilus harrisii]